MTQQDEIDPTRWELATRALAAFAVDPNGLGGVWLRARAGPVRMKWLDALKRIAPTQKNIPPRG